MKISLSIPFRMKDVSDRNCGENQNTYFMFNNLFSESRAVYEIMLKNTIQPSSP
jgi:hypothetical protein